MTDLVAELRRRAKAVDSELRIDDLNAMRQAGFQAGLRTAADLLDADPIYKATDPAIELLRDIHDLPMGPLRASDVWPADIHKRFYALLAMIPPPVCTFVYPETGEVCGVPQSRAIHSPADIPGWKPTFPPPYGHHFVKGSK